MPLAQKGVPLLLQPKSGLIIITVTAWDDRAGGKFNEEPKEIFVLETFTGSSPWLPQADISLSKLRSRWPI